MLKKLALLFSVLALAVASAGTPAFKGGKYRINLVQPSVVNGTALKAGEYFMTVDESKVTILNGKEPLEVPAKIESVDRKYDHTAIRYSSDAGKTTITEIRIGGTNTKVVFNP